MNTETVLGSVEAYTTQWTDKLQIKFVLYKPKN